MMLENSVMNNISLSFCIPTYNRSKIVYENVMRILTCPDMDLEVVVLDNGSTDNTLSLLGSIEDSRLSIYSNGENKGVLYNILHALDKGRGKYVVFSTDKDSFKSEEIRNFKSFLLNQNQLSAGFCQYNSKKDIIFESFPKGINAVRAIAYQARHPTGYFFNNKFLKSIKLVDRFSDYSIVDTFPFDFVFGELCTFEDGFIYHSDLITPESQVMASKIRSFGTDGSKKDAFFSPESRLRMALNFSRHIDTLVLSNNEKSVLINDVFMRGLLGATTGYRTILRSQHLCDHYGMNVRNVGYFEIFKLGLRYINGFLHGIRSTSGKRVFSTLSFLIGVFVLVVEKIFTKFGKIFK